MKFHLVVSHCSSLSWSNTVKVNPIRLLNCMKGNVLIEFLRKIFKYLFSSRLHELGYDVGTRVTDLYVVRDKNSKRETRLINILLFIKGTIWKVSK